MSTNAINHLAIRDLLEKALQQVVTTQSQVSTIEEHLQGIKTQVNLSLESIDTILKQVEASEQNTERVRSDVAATLGEMFDHMSRIVNGAREKMINHQETLSHGSQISDPSPGEKMTEIESEASEAPLEPLPKSATEEMAAQEIAVAAADEEVLENTKNAEPEVAEPEIAEITVEASPEIETSANDGEQQSKQSAVQQTNPLAEQPLEPVMEQQAELQDEQQPVESLNGNEAGQRAAESIDEMMSTIQENNQSPAEAVPSAEAEIAQPEIAAQSEVLENHDAKQAENLSDETPKETHNGPGSVKPLSELLAKARAEGGEPVEGPTELTPMVEEDAEAVSELLNNTSGSIVAQ